MDGRDFDVDVSGGASGGRIPVFCFPSFFVFSGTDRDQVKQILTIYNPYDFPIRFRVLSTALDHYEVLNPEGSIKSKNCIDLIIQLTDQIPPTSLIPLESRFRIQIFQYGTKQAVGRKDVPSTIIYGHGHQQSDSIDSDTFEAPGDSTSASSSAKTSRRSRNDPPTAFQDYSYAQPQNINYVAIITGLVCIIGLLLPLDKDEPSSMIPGYLHLSVNQKLMIAYALGLVTMALFRL